MWGVSTCSDEKPTVPSVRGMNIVSVMNYQRWGQRKSESQPQMPFTTLCALPASSGLSQLSCPSFLPYHPVSNLLSVSISVCVCVLQTVFRIVVLGIWDYIENKVEVSSHGTH